MSKPFPCNRNTGRKFIKSEKKPFCTYMSFLNKSISVIAFYSVAPSSARSVDSLISFLKELFSKLRIGTNASK